MKCISVREYTNQMNHMLFPCVEKFPYKGESISDLEECMGKHFWNYPVEEIDHVDEMGLDFAIVKCSDGYRLCEI